MITSAMLLMGEHGVDATSFSQVLAHSGAPRGSIYHHFPGGKAQLVEEATRFGGNLITAGLTAALETEDPIAAVDGVADFWRAALRENEFAIGCPVVAATVDGARVPGARQAAREAFERWQDLHSQILQRAGVDESRSRSLATIVVAGIEGAVILSRAEHSSEPLERAVDELHRLLRAAVERGRS
jgi:TetR/AcrR family transcriptional regulator, lmrAB and yxaGH operons repressor